MASNAKLSRSSTAKREPAVVYRGIRIEPIDGKRSETSKLIRDALLKKTARKVRQAKSG